jgi:hypothetical protein
MPYNQRPQSRSMRGDLVAATDDPSPQRFYHGTKADLKTGDLIEPGYPVTSSLDAAAWEGELAPGEGPGRIDTDETKVAESSSRPPVSPITKSGVSRRLRNGDGIP